MLFQLFSYITGGERRKKAKALSAGEDPDGDAATLDVLAAIEKFSGVRPDPEAFIEALDPLQPRLYSISSSPKVHKGRVALTVDAVRYDIGKRKRLGVASTFLAGRVEPGARLRVYVQKAHAFGLPADPNVPIIMIGPGTGVAPFRAFLHERMATKAPGRNWLFFGHQKRDFDFFYEDEFSGMKAAGRADAAVARLVARRRREILRAGPHAAGRPRAVVVDRRRRACLCLRRRPAHGQGRRARADRHRRAARRPLDQRGGRFRRRAEEGRAAIRRTCIDPCTPRSRSRPSPEPPAPIAASAAACRRGRTASAAPSPPAIPIIRRTSAGCARRALRWKRRSGSNGRLLHPMLRRADGSHARVDWDTALSTVADGFRRVIERDGPDAVAFYLSGQLLTEDYYVANKLMKGFLGSANVDTNSRLCMASTVAGHRRAFGEDVVPGCYEDLDEADLIVLVGSNAAWCHPVLYQRMTRNRRERGAKIVVIDPRRTATGDEADLFLAIAPGTDTALFSGLLVHLADIGALDQAYIDAHTDGL